MSNQSVIIEIVKKLLKYPPSISGLAEYIQNHEDYSKFVKLIREYLPDYEIEILSKPTISLQITEFAKLFEESYFMLDDYFSGDASSYSELVDHIPYPAMGWTYEDYDMLISDGSTGFRFMTFLYCSPFDDGIRASLADSISEYLDEHVRERIPVNGYTPEEMHRFLDNSEYEILATWGDILFQNTGNPIIDTDYENSLYNTLEWTRENVSMLTKYWQQYIVINQKLSEFSKKLEQNPSKNFSEIIDFIARRQNALGI